MVVVGAKYSCRESENNRQEGSESTGCSHRGFAVSWGGGRAFGLTNKREATSVSFKELQPHHMLSPGGAGVCLAARPRGEHLAAPPAGSSSSSEPCTPPGRQHATSLPALSGPRSQRPPLAGPCPTCSFRGCPSNWRALVKCSGFAQ